MLDWKIFKGQTPFTLGNGYKRDWGGPGNFDFVPSRISDSYNEGDDIKTSFQPVWDLDENTGIPITPGHNPCGYWWKNLYGRRYGCGGGYGIPMYSGEDEDEVYGYDYGHGRVYPCCDDPEVDDLTFDDDNTPDTIVAGDSIIVYILGGCAPFTYTVSGTGYTWAGSGTSSYESDSRSEQLDCAGGT